MKTRYTALQIALEAIGALLIVLMAVFVIVHWNTLPEAIPVHYDSHGDVDRWASRWEIFVMPLIGLAIYLLLTVLAVCPTRCRRRSGAQYISGCAPCWAC